MKKQFVTYEIALALKELGFDETCIARFTAQKNLVTSGCYTDSDPITLGVCNSDIHESNIAAPLWQQVLDWLRTEHNIIIGVHRTERTVEGFMYMYYVENWGYDDIVSEYWDYFKTFEEAREAAIVEAIKIVKGN